MWAVPVLIFSHKHAQQCSQKSLCNLRGLELSGLVEVKLVPFTSCCWWWNSHCLSRLMLLGPSREILVLVRWVSDWQQKASTVELWKSMQMLVCQCSTYKNVHNFGWQSCRSGWSQEVNSRVLCRLEEMELKFEWPLLSQVPPARYYLLGPGQSMRTLRRMKIQYFPSHDIFEIGEAAFMHESLRRSCIYKQCRGRSLGTPPSLQDSQESLAYMNMSFPWMNICVSLGSKMIRIVLHCKWSPLCLSTIIPDTFIVL